MVSYLVFMDNAKADQMIETVINVINTIQQLT